MITSEGPDTRILSKEEQKERNKIMRKPDNYTATEIADHGLTDLVRGRKYDPDAWKINTSPVDPRDTSKKVDFRKTRPELGD